MSEMQIKELQEQIEVLKKTVTDLQNSTIRVETNLAKLCRLKKEIIREVLPKEVIEKASNLQVSQYSKNATIVTNDIFEMKYNIKKESFKKMDSVIFGYSDSEQRLNNYLGIFKNVCEFMAQQYSGEWYAYGDRADVHIKIGI